MAEQQEADEHRDTHSPPPWQHWHGPPHTPPPWMRASMQDGWKRQRRFFVKRFASVLLMMMILVGSGMALLAFLLTRLMGGNAHTTLLVWIGGMGLALALPLLALALGLRAFRTVAMPLADIMTAADSVTAGDLSVRVPERGSGEFVRLARSFNTMMTELQRSDQQRRNLTADVAHELRTPLHIIQGNLEGILDGVYEPSNEHIAATLEETRQLSRLVDDLRTLSLAESGQLPLKREPVNVADLLADVVTSFSVQAENAGIQLTQQSTTVSESLTIEADGGRLDQVLSNLVSNALRHTPSGGSISLSATQTDEQIIIRVSDTGEGIAAEEQPFVFDRFWRGDRARTRSGGTGLGLSIASQLIKAHGGRIRVNSEVGKGTTFVIELPRRVSSQ